MPHGIPNPPMKPGEVITHYKIRSKETGRFHPLYFFSTLDGVKRHLEWSTEHRGDSRASGEDAEVVVIESRIVRIMPMNEIFLPPTPKPASKPKPKCARCDAVLPKHTDDCPTQTRIAMLEID